MRVLEFEVVTRSPYLYELATRNPQSSTPNNISRLSICDTQLYNQNSKNTRSHTSIGS